MNLLFINWGAHPGNHAQCIFALLTAFRYNDCFDDYYVITDRPDFYYFMGDRVKVIPITEQQITEWKGEENYLFHVKIKGIAYFNQLHPDKAILYTDADIFFYNKPDRLRALLQEKKAFMHLNEGSFESYMKHSHTARRVFPKLAALDLGKYKVTKETCMFNAGILGIPQNDNLQELLDDVLSLSKFLCKQDLKMHYMEQLAFSLVLQDAYQPLYSSNDCIGHYWGNKEAWENAITLFLVGAHIQNLPIDETVASLSGFNFNIPVICKKRIMNTRLNKLARKFFPDRLKNFNS
jgi:hypothetical protein